MCLRIKIQSLSLRENVFQDEVRDLGRVLLQCFVSYFKDVGFFVQEFYVIVEVVQVVE